MCNNKKRNYLEAFSDYVKLYEGNERSINFIKIKNNKELLSNLSFNEKKLTLLLGICKTVGGSEQMRDIINQFAKICPSIHFIEAELDDENEEMRSSLKIEKIPTFIFYRYKKAIHRIEGGFPEQVKESLIKLSEGDVVESDWEEGGKNKGQLPKGTLDLIHYLNVGECEALNSADQTSFEHFMARKSSLRSDCDEQLILSYGFNQDVKLHFVEIKAEVGKGPKSLKIFINQLKSMDFDDVETTTPTQRILLNSEEGELIECKEIGGRKVNNLRRRWFIELDQVKFQKVKCVIIFIEDNFCGGDVTEVEEINLFGIPLNKNKGISGRESSIITIP